MQNGQGSTEQCAHDWRTVDTVMSGTMSIYFVMCRRCGARRDVGSVDALNALKADRPKARERAAL
jgi:hypothetical protein